MPVKVLDAAGEGTDADLARGIIWATDHGARVINMSLGGPGASAVLDNAVRYALQHEVVLVAAAGNEGSQVLSYPAAAPGVLGVTATDAAGRFAWFSNHGPWYYLAAPGIGIRSTALAGGAAAAYTSDSGTSFSSPIVAGIAALLRERHPGWGWFEVADELLRTARDAGPAGLDDAYEFGIVDASAALGVSPLGAVSQPNRTGDAANLRSGARVIAPGSTANEAIGYEYDEDWFVFDVPSEAGATIAVTPPALAGTDSPRAAEMDPIVEVYGSGGGLEARVDDGFAGEGENLQIELAAGRHALRVRNYLGSASPAPYTVQVTLGAPLPPTAWAPWEQVFDAGSAWEEAVAVADYNGDGRDDVVMATGTGTAGNEFQLLVFTQGPDGSLSAPERLPTHATYPGSGDPLQAADLDDDGDIDVARGSGAGLDIAWNDGGELTEPVLYPAGGAIRWIRPADLDGSEPTELVVQGGASMRVLRWSGDDMAVETLDFAAPEYFADNGINYDVADLTGDGRADITTLEVGAVSVHAQQPDGTWAAPTAIDLPGFDGSRADRDLVTSDVNGDGRTDIVAVGAAGEAGSNTLFYRVQQPDGSFAPPLTLPVDPAGVGSMRVADVTADGRNDVVLLHGGGRAGIVRQMPDGALAEEHVLEGAYASFHRSADSLSIGDLDGDGVNDLAAASYNFGLYVHRHQSVATAEGAGPWVAAASPGAHATGVATTARPSVTFGRDVAAASVNADTVALVDGRTGGVVPSSLSRSGRTVTLTPNAPLRPGVPYQVWIAGVTDPNGTEIAYERIPFTTAPGPAPSYTVNRTLTPIRVDLDGNGYEDIFWYAPGDGADSIWMFGPDGRTGIPTSVRGTYTPIAGDFDGNGYEDIFWYGPGSGTDVMWWNAFDGITPAVVQVRGVYVPIAGDFDRNGYDDIFWYGPGSDPDSVWYFSPFGHTGVAQSVGGTYRPAAGDFTRDGYDDVVWYAPGAAAENLWRGSPMGFAKSPTMSITGTYRTRPLDRNGDGYDEVFLYATDRGVFWRSGPTGFTSVQTGPPIASGGRPVAGDFTGDLRDDLFAYVPGTAPDPFYPGG
jgi:serine protease